MRFTLILSILLALFGQCTGQTPNFTAQDFVPKFEGKFGYGVNPGVYPPHYMDIELSDLSRSFGANTMRPALPEHFLTTWGYGIRTDAFQHYQDIGMRDLTVFIGFPSPQHRDSVYFCPGEVSELFENMYEPIWDNGENGTPINEKNPYALYVWQTARTYGSYIKFWEVWNEPDVDTGNGWAPPGVVGNWWENIPSPCETKLKAPVFYYIRLLRITYEVIKAEQPDDFVCVGGIGWPSYLDMLCRYTDNPFDGTVSSKYPLKGGAYFDVLSYHSYPHIDNSLREWDNSIFDFRHFRHSDAAVAGIWKQKDKFETVLKNHGFGTQFPDKQWIISELNIPRRQFGDYIGSDAAQVNFMIKALVTAQAEQVRQIHVYSLADEVPENAGGNEFAYMGLFKNLNDIAIGAAQPNALAYAFKTTSTLLENAEFDQAATNQLQLPDQVRGFAFSRPAGPPVYVLWAVTNKDRDETANAIYAFPDDMNITYVEQKPWHYAQTGTNLVVPAKQVPLTGSPVFLTQTLVSEKQFPKTPTVVPNPTIEGRAVLSFWLFEDEYTTVQVYDAQGKLVHTIANNILLLKGPHEYELDWTNFAKGVYMIQVVTPESKLATKVFRK